MSILAALVNVYDRLDEKGLIAPFGYATKDIHCCLVIDDKGEIVGSPALWHRDEKGKPSSRKMDVPYFGGRSGTRPPPYFLWDNTAYVLGVSAKENSDSTQRFAAFRDYHIEALRTCDDHGLHALVQFLNKWRPENFKDIGLPEDIKDKNIVFRLSDEFCLLHERPTSVDIWKTIYIPDTIGNAICLVTGNEAAITRLHPPISNFENPARIVSFDLDNDAFSSYGHLQAANAPTGIVSAFSYTATLNRFLERGSRHRIQIGDASTVFWADASEADDAETAEGVIAAMFSDIDESQQAEKIGVILKKIRRGLPLREIAPDLEKRVRCYVLALAPNKARLSIRFWLDNDFGELADRYWAYLCDIAFEPWPANRHPPSIRTLVLRTAPARRDGNNKITFSSDDISPPLAGELLRSILTGARFPGALLGQLIMRIRNDHLVDSTRVALIKAILVRDMRLKGLLPANKETYLVRSDPDDPNPARRLGRLFALIERAQLAALGEEINTTVKDKFLGAAAATPLQVFVGLTKNAEQHHLRRLRNGHSDAKWIKDEQMARRVGHSLGRDIGRLWASLSDSLPIQHSIEEQGFFLVGYYQERFGTRCEAGPNTDIELEEASEREE